MQIEERRASQTAPPKRQAVKPAVAQNSARDAPDAMPRAKPARQEQPARPAPPSEPQVQPKPRVQQTKQPKPLPRQPVEEEFDIDSILNEYIREMSSGGSGGSL